MTREIATVTASSRADPFAAPQRAASRVQLGERVSGTAEVEVTPAGMLAFGAMVGMVLLGSAAIVRAARR